MLALLGAGWVMGRAGIGAPAVDPASLSDREREFSEQMSHVSLVGRFTLIGHENRQAEPDRYDIAGVEKVGGDRWRFKVRMRHGSVDVTVPVVLPVQWVGDRPMIAISDYRIPTLGTFSAHVIFDGNRYAGTWQNGPSGGQMFGRIEKQP